MSNDQGLKVLQAEIKNFKNIDYRKIDIEGRSIMLIGPNQAGKSSLIQAICSPVNTNYIPVEPIKQGEEKGHVELVIGNDEVKYKVATYFSQQHKRGRLVVHDSEGNPIKGGERGILEGIVGDISFDIMKFIEMGMTNTGKVSKEGVRKQIEILKELMPREDLKRLYELDHEKQAKYDERTEVNRDVKYLSGQIDNAGFTQEEIEKYNKPMDIGDLTEKIQKARKTNEMIQKSQDFVNETANFVNDTEEEIKKLVMQIELKKKEISDRVAQDKKCAEYISKNAFVDIEEMEAQFGQISDHNTKHNEVKKLHEVSKERQEKEAKSQELTDRLKAIDQEKKDLFANTKMPVKGLAFDDEKVTFRGLPLSEGNIPTSQLIGVGLKIGMALNPNLRLLVIRDGSLLDQKTMNYVLDQCHKKGYQLLIEMVKHEGGELSVEFIESEGE